VLLDEQQTVPSAAAHLAFDPAFTRLYADGWLAGEGR
jgi:hypothetical protein